MSNLKQIARRHGRDRWKDLIFIAGALLLTGLAIGATTSKGVGKPMEHTWTIQVVDPATGVALNQ